MTQQAFRERFLARFFDPAFDGAKAEVEKLCAIAWDGYINARKAPRTRAAGPGFSDPSYEISVEWLATRDAVAMPVEMVKQRETRALPADLRLLGWRGGGV